MSELIFALEITGLLSYIKIFVVAMSSMLLWRYFLDKSSS